MAQSHLIPKGPNCLCYATVVPLQINSGMTPTSSNLLHSSNSHLFYLLHLSKEHFTNPTINAIPNYLTFCFFQPQIIATFTLDWRVWIVTDVLLHPHLFKLVRSAIGNKIEL